MKRDMQPKGSVIVRPATVSQLSSLAVLGVDARRFLEAVVPACARVSSVGRLRIVTVDDAERALLSLASVPHSADDADSDEIDGAEAVLRALGRQRKAAGQ